MMIPSVPYTDMAMMQLGNNSKALDAARGGQTPERSQRAAQDVESFFLSKAFEQMLPKDDNKEGRFSYFGGHEGRMFFSAFVIPAVAEQMAQGGGIGIASMVYESLTKTTGDAHEQQSTRSSYTV